MNDYLFQTADGEPTCDVQSDCEKSQTYDTAYKYANVSIIGINQIFYVIKISFQNVTLWLEDFTAAWTKMMSKVTDGATLADMS